MPGIFRYAPLAPSALAAYLVQSMPDGASVEVRRSMILGTDSRRMGARGQVRKRKRAAVDRRPAISKRMRSGSPRDRNVRTPE